MVLPWDPEKVSAGNKNTFEMNFLLHVSIIVKIIITLPPKKNFDEVRTVNQKNNKSLLY